MLNEWEEEEEELDWNAKEDGYKTDVSDEACCKELCGFDS